MKTTRYSCDNEDCDTTILGELPSRFIEISGGELGLNINNGIENRRLIKLELHSPIHFCSQNCFTDYFFKPSK